MLPIRSKNVKIADDSEIAEGQKTAIEPVAYYDDYNYKKVKLIPTGNGKVSGELVISCDNQEDIVITLSGTADWTSSADKVRNLTKYVVYSFIVSDGADGGSTYSIDGKLPDGMSFDSNKKEIYGAPLKEGRYDFSVIKVKDGKRTTKTYTFLVSANCDECVMNETHQKSFNGFEKDWSKDALVFDNFFRVQATVPNKSAIDNVKKLLSHPSYDGRNPNRVRALAGALALSNPVALNDISGEGYDLLCKQISALNDINPSVAARILTPLLSFRRLDEKRQGMILNNLNSLMQMPKLSRSIYEKVSTALKE